MPRQDRSNTQQDAVPSAKTFLRATLRDGTQVVSVFTKLAGVENYARDVFAMRKPFNAWQIVGTAHPASGEQVLMRQRRVYNGSQIVSIEQVRPVSGREEDHGLQAENFEPVTHTARGRDGTYQFTAANAPEGAQVGIDYPVHRDPTRQHGFNRYVVLRIAHTSEEGQQVPESRYYIDRPASAAPYVEVSGPADADDDDPFGDGE